MLATLVTHVEHLREDVSEMREDFGKQLTRIDQWVRGNGKKGAEARIARLEESFASARLSSSRWLDRLWGVVTPILSAAVGGAVVLLLQAMQSSGGSP
jgi:hypothetical protein